MRCLIDGDIIRYEVGYAAEAGYKATHPDEPDALPPWEYVEGCLSARLAIIEEGAGSSEPSTIYITTGENFRDQIATVKPYKGNRVSKKPWHFDNLTAYMKGILGVVECDKGLEADDVMTIDHLADPNSIICTRDKDLRQVPGWLYSWELGRQPSFGPIKIDKLGDLTLNDKKKLTGTGLSFFYAQCLMGDTTDNIPGLPGWGPVAAYDLLEGSRGLELSYEVYKAYEDHYGSEWEERLLEQGRLLWMTREMKDGMPVLWEIGMEE